MNNDNQNKFSISMGLYFVGLGVMVNLAIDLIGKLPIDPILGKAIFGSVIMFGGVWLMNKFSKY